MPKRIDQIDPPKKHEDLEYGVALVSDEQTVKYFDSFEEAAISAFTRALKAEEPIELGVFASSRDGAAAYSSDAIDAYDDDVDDEDDPVIVARFTINAD